MSKSKQKRIVYLFGAGATQAELTLVNSTIRLLTRDIKEGILGRITENDSLNSRYPELINELSNETLDVEHLITLYESGGNIAHAKIAKLLRQLFRKEIQSRLDKLGKDFSPTLYPALIDMHEVKGFDEKIVGILTLNYEELLECGVQSIKNSVDYSIQLNSSHSKLKAAKGQDFPVLKLHGSFNWQNTLPITLTDENKIKKEENVLWIPPGVVKKWEKYPFSILWGRAMEILNCDTLRVIGCSLNRNDWQLISLIYTTHKLSTGKQKYKIELLNSPEVCRKIKENYSYLNFIMITQMKEVRQYITKDYARSGKKILPSAINKHLESHHNIFDLWLRAKGDKIINSGLPISTPTNIFENYLKESAGNEN